MKPWEPLDMSTKDWLDIEPEKVNPRDLHWTQESVHEWAVIAVLRGDHLSFSGDHCIHVVEWEGKLYISDGHTRVEAALRRGDGEIEARVLRGL